MTDTINDILSMNGSEFLNGEPGIVKFYAAERLSGILYHENTDKGVVDCLTDKGKNIEDYSNWAIILNSGNSEYILKYIVVDNIPILPGDLNKGHLKSVLGGFVFLEAKYKELAAEYNEACDLN